MYGIDVLVSEHKNIVQMTKIIRAASLCAMKDGTVDTADYRRMIEFIRGYADKYHHGKEEKILFRRMEEKLGPVAAKLIRGGMLVEHDQGRFFVRELEEALGRAGSKADDSDRLDIIVAGMEWANLLVRHAGKEDSAVYPFAERNFKPEELEEIDRETREYEAAAASSDEVSAYLETVRELTAKYLL